MQNNEFTMRIYQIYTLKYIKFQYFILLYCVICIKIL
jgi:hypothetical protein